LKRKRSGEGEEKKIGEKNLLRLSGLYEQVLSFEVLGLLKVFQDSLSYSKGL
jgi:hypothetical protein